MPDTTSDRYRYGQRLIRSFPVKASETINTGDFVDLDASGYLQACDAGDIPLGVAAGKIATAPSSDGDVSCAVDVSHESVYEYPPDSGTLTLALAGKTCDVAAAQAIDPDASTDDVILIDSVDTDANTAFIRLRPTHSGVV